jgi:hypothetical protein
MSAIRPLPLQPHHAAVDVKPASQLTPTTKPIFQTLKDSIHSVWRWTTTIVRTVGDKISFVFFGVIECVFPSLGPKIHNLFLYARLSVQAIWNARTIETLRAENELLRGKAQFFTTTRDENERLALEIGQVRTESKLIKQVNQQLTDENQTAKQRLQGLEVLQPNILSRENAVVQDRDIMVQKNAQLQKQNVVLAAERDALLQNLRALQIENPKLMQELKRVQQEVLDLQFQMQQNAEIGPILERVEQPEDQLSPAEKTGIDDDREKLLPLLLRQIEGLRTRLQAEGPNLPPHTLLSSGRILDELVALISRITEALYRHSNWNNKVNQVANLQFNGGLECH